MALKEQDVMSEVDYLSVETLQLWSDVALKTFLQASRLARAPLEIW